MIKIFILLFFVSFLSPISSSEINPVTNHVTNYKWPSKSDTMSNSINNPIMFNFYPIYFKNKITNIYFNTDKKSVLIDFKNNTEILLADATQQQETNFIKTLDYFYYENDKYSVYFKSIKRPEYTQMIIVPKVKNDYTKSVLVKGYFTKQDVEFLLSNL